MDCWISKVEYSRRETCRKEDERNRKGTNMTLGEVILIWPAEAEAAPLLSHWLPQGKARAFCNIHLTIQRSCILPV